MEVAEVGEKKLKNANTHQQHNPHGYPRHSEMAARRFAGGGTRQPS
jgi:hypothetical protein